MPSIRARRTAAVQTTLALVAGAATAGPLDRSGQSVAVIFEEGGYVEFSLTHVDPRVDGEGLATFDPLAPLRALGAEAPPIGLPGAGSGSVSRDHSFAGAAVKLDLGRALSAALIYDEPWGADTYFPLGTGFYAAGTLARADSEAATGLLRYRHRSGLSVHGGLRYQTYETAVDAPVVFAPPTQDAVAAAIASGEPVPRDGYSGRGARDGAWGYVLGAAYEVPAIAARVSLTYSSEIEHELDVVERGPAPGTSVMALTTPESVNLEFQTGVAAGTLIFGGVRWTDYSEFDVRPMGFAAATATPENPDGLDIVSYEDDAFDWTLGVGRQLTEDFAGAVSITYATGAGGEFKSILGPTDGYVSVGLGGTYTAGPIELTGAVSYAWLGDAEATLDGEAPVATFEDNEAVALRAKVAYRF